MREKEGPCPKALYMAVTDDIYELPVAVCDTASELARVLGYRPGTVYSFLSRSRDGTVRLRREGIKLFRMDADTGHILCRRKKSREGVGNRTCGAGGMMVK